MIGPNGSGHTTMLVVTCTTAVRCRVFEYKGSCNATPADQSWELTIGRTTLPGTSTAYTPQPFDNQEVGSQLTSGTGISHSVDATFSATSLDQIALNQRASWKWQAVPGFEIVGAATANNGIGLQQVAATATLVTLGSMFFFE